MPRIKQNPHAFNQDAMRATCLILVLELQMLMVRAFARQVVAQGTHRRPLLEISTVCQAPAQCSWFQGVGSVQVTLV